MNITVAKSWDQLNAWQLQEIAILYLTAKEKNFAEAYKKMIFIIYQKTPNYESYRKLRKLVGQVPISELEIHTSWLLNNTDYYTFPTIEGLIKPADALGDITIRQFSTIDQFYYFWTKDKSLLNIKRLVASLYRINDNFDDVDLPRVDAITRHLSVGQLYAIALSYIFTRLDIVKSFPLVFPPPKPMDDITLSPIFAKKADIYAPFDKMILGIAMDEVQPLGNKQQANKVRVYEFLSVISESIIRHQEK